MRTHITDDYLGFLAYLALLVAMALLVMTALYVIRKIRSKTLQQELSASDLLSNFRELHDRGELTDAEFRTIKATLAARLQQELKDNVKTG
jgi:uncharacterized membrane protein